MIDGVIHAVFGLVAALPLDDKLLVAAVVLARLALPLLIPRVPLFILAALVLDAVDQTIFQLFTELDTTETGPYQGFDKALDIYYLAIAYMAMLRNWTSDAAVRIGQMLFIYRLVGVTLFELTDTRALLLIFPNTFEYYFIAFEAWCLWRDPARRTARFWLLAALGIWVFIKLPQEYWIHVAQLDTTDLVREHPAVGVAGLVGIVALAAFAQFWVRPRLPAHDWKLRVTADPLPTSISESRKRHALVLARGVVWSEIAEKALGLLSLIVIIFASILPGAEIRPLNVFIGVTAIVIANTAVSHWVARRGGTRFGSSTFVAFPLFVLLNLGFVFASWVILERTADDEFPLGTALFFAYLIAIVIWLYDRYKPIHDARFENSPLRVTGIANFAARVRAPCP